MTKYIVLLAMFGMVNTSYGNQIDCSDCGCTKTCTTSYNETTEITTTNYSEVLHNEVLTEYDLEEIVINGPPDRPVPVPDPHPEVRPNKPKKFHCTEQSEYDELYSNIVNNNGNYNGYYLDSNDHSTIWSPKRDNRITRCLPVNLDKDTVKGTSGGGSKGGGGNYERLIRRIHVVTLSIYDYVKSWSESTITTHIEEETICVINPIPTPTDPGVSPVPEPTTLILFGAGLIGIVGLHRRRN